MRALTDFMVIKCGITVAEDVEGEDEEDEGFLSVRWRIRRIKLGQQGEVANESCSYVATVCSECMDENMYKVCDEDAG